MAYVKMNVALGNDYYYDMMLDLGGQIFVVMR